MSHECVDEAHDNRAVDVLKSTEHDDPTGNLMSDFSEEGMPEEGEVEDGEIDDEDTGEAGKTRSVKGGFDTPVSDVNVNRSILSEGNQSNLNDANRSKKRDKHKKKRDKRKHSNDRTRHHSKRGYGDNGQDNGTPAVTTFSQKRPRNGRTSDSKSRYDDAPEDVDDDMMGVYGRPPPVQMRSPVYYGNEMPSEEFQSRSRSPSISGSTGTADSIGKQDRLMDYIVDEEEIDVHVASLEKEEIFRSRDDPRDVATREQRKRQRRTKKGKEFMQRRRQRESQSNQRTFEHVERKQCKYYMEGRCGKAENCHFSHDFKPPKKQELCKFYAISTCLKGDHCVYLHEEFPCKFYHTGSKFCREADDCKFSHAPLTQLSRSLVERFVEERPFSLNNDDEYEESCEFSEEKKNSLLGTPPAHMKNSQPGPIQHQKYAEELDQTPFGFHTNDAEGPNDLDMYNGDATSRLSPPNSRPNNFYNNQGGNFGPPRGIVNNPNGPRGHTGPIPRLMGGPMRPHLGGGNMNGPMRHPGAGPMRHPGGPMNHSNNMNMGHLGIHGNQQDGNMNMGGPMGSGNFSEHESGVPRMSGPDNRPGGPMQRMLNPNGPMLNPNCGPPQHMFPMRGPPMNQTQPPPFMPNCPPPGMQAQMPQRFRPRMHMGGPPGVPRLQQPRGMPPPIVQHDFMSNQLDKIAQLFMAGKEAAEKIASETAAAEEAAINEETFQETQVAKQEDSVLESNPNSTENVVPPGAYVPQSTSVLPSVRLGESVQPADPADVQALSSQLMGVPTSTSEAITDIAGLPSPNITGSSPLGICGNLTENKDVVWRLVALDVPVKIPYPLMQLPNDVPHLHNDPRLKGQAGVMRAGKDITARRNSDTGVEEGFVPIVPLPPALLEKPPPLKEFRIDALCMPIAGVSTSEPAVEPTTPTIASPSPSHKPYQLQLNEMSTTFLQDSSAVSVAQQQLSKTDRSYLADPRFRRRKANTGTSPRSSGEAGQLQSASSPTS